MIFMSLPLIVLKALPESSFPQDQHPFMKKNDFAHSLEEIKERIGSFNFDISHQNIKFVKGFFNNSLTDSLREELSEFPPAIVTVDVDYYSSTKTVLEWLRPILRSGTLFYFDDIWSFHGNPNYGQLAEINEFNKAEDGFLASFPKFGMSSMIYIFSKKEFEY